RPQNAQTRFLWTRRSLQPLVLCRRHHHRTRRPAPACRRRADCESAGAARVGLVLPGPCSLSRPHAVDHLRPDRPALSAREGAAGVLGRTIDATLTIATPTKMMAIP